MSKHDDVLFWIVRHGSTEANEEDIYRSWSNAKKAQLSDLGRQESDEAAVYLAAIKAPIKIIIADSLDRTIESSERIGHKLGVQVYENIRGLHPLDMGDFTLEPKKKYPLEEYMKNPEKRIPGGETRAEFDKRQRETFSAIMEIVPDYPPGSVLILGHGSNVSYLHNQIYSPQGVAIPYEGLVNPGGVIKATDEVMKPLTKIRAKVVGKE